MILTVTPDPVLDKIFIIDEWTPGLPMKIAESTISVGGKGLDASVALSHLGVETTGITFLAGKTGQELLGRVTAYDIQALPIWVAGETRTAYVIAERNPPRHSHLFSGAIEVGRQQRQDLLALLNKHLNDSAWLVTGGILPPSLPADFFSSIIMCAHQAGVPVLLDAHSQHLQNALSAQPQIIKLNWREFEWSFNHPAKSLDSLIRAGSEVYRSLKLKALVITCGADGLLAFTHQGAFLARPPAMPVVNAAGAGDAVSAALAWRFSRGESWPDALPWAAAASAAVVLTTGTADLRLADLQHILPRTSVELIYPAG